MKIYGVFATIVLLFILQAAGQDADNVELEDETRQPIEEPPIIKVNYYRPGDRVYFNPEIPELQELAVQFLPYFIKFQNIIEAYREITNRVRFTISLNGVVDYFHVKCVLVLLEGYSVQTVEDINCRRVAPNDDNINSQNFYFD